MAIACMQRGHANPKPIYSFSVNWCESCLFSGPYCLCVLHLLRLPQILFLYSNRIPWALRGGILWRLPIQSLFPLNGSLNALNYFLIKYFWIRHWSEVSGMSSLQFLTLQLVSVRPGLPLMPWTSSKPNIGWSFLQVLCHYFSGTSLSQDMLQMDSFVARLVIMFLFWIAFKVSFFIIL